MIHYVAGLLFDTDHKVVVLILKDRGPQQLIGKWDAVGGKMTPGEHPPAAMHREFLEETGVSVLPRAWTRFLTLRSAHDGPNFSAGMEANKVSAALEAAYEASKAAWCVDFFRAALPLEALKRARTMETEQVRVFQLYELSAIPDDAFVPNLRWIIPMALSGLGPYDVKEEEDHG